MLKLDLVTIVFTLINLLVLYLILKKFLFGPILSVMKQREDMIEGKFTEAETAKNRADALKLQYEEKIKTAEVESSQIIEKAKSSAAAQYDAKVKDADDKAKFILAKAQEQISLEREKTLKDLESQIAGIALTAADKIVAERADDAKNQSMYDEFLAKAGDVDDTDGQ
ncbi:MAG: F0F1 ATP synthase subunit B [Lachnospiraceae bacterium]